MKWTVGSIGDSDSAVKGFVFGSRSHVGDLPNSKMPCILPGMRILPQQKYVTMPSQHGPPK